MGDEAEVDGATDEDDAGWAVELAEDDEGTEAAGNDDDDGAGVEEAADD